MLDAQIVAASIASKAAYDKVAPFLTKKDMTPAGGFWWELVTEWYGNDPACRSVDLSVLRDVASTRMPNPKLRDTLYGFLNELPLADSPENTALAALELKRYNVGMELGAAIASGDNKKAAVLLPQLTELMQATELRKGDKSQITLALSVDDLFNKVGHENRIALAPALLNERIDGGALPGHHILLFGRPEASKTTFAINMTGSLVRRKYKVLYCGNEDQIDVLKARALCRITGMTWDDAEKNKAKAIGLFKERGGEEYLRMAQIRHAKASDLRPLIEDFGPQIIVLDQIRNLQAGTDENITQNLNRVAQDVRALLLDYGLIGLSVTQANDRTERHGQEPPVYLGMGDVDSSRTGLPAQADLMLGIGSNEEMRARNERAISLPKNKLSSKPNAHAGFIVTVDHARSLVK